MDTYSPAALPPITSLEVVSLKHVEVNRVDQYMKNSADAASVTLDGADAQRIADLWKSLPPGQQSRCHIPPYGLRFRSSGRIICEASICWKCDNIFGDADGQPLHYAFDASHATSLELLAELRRVLGESAGSPGLD